MCWCTCFGEHKVGSSMRGQVKFRSSNVTGCIPDVDKPPNVDESIPLINVKNLNGTQVQETQQDIKANIAKPQEISVFEILEAEDCSGKNILTGASGEMYYGVLVNGREAAIRKIDSKNPSQYDFQLQVSKISRLKHDNIVELLGFCAHPNLRALAYEHAAAGSLYDILYGRKDTQGSEPGPVLSWPQRVKIALGAARGLHYLHSDASRPTVIHGKVKSSNVLIFGNHVAKLADPNLSDQPNDFNVGLNNTCSLGAFGYTAPECAFGRNITEESDVYSFGVVLLELITGRKPIDRSLEKRKHSLVNWVEKTGKDFGRDVPNYHFNFIETCRLIHEEEVTPNLKEDRVELCVDEKLRGEYPKKALARMAALAAQCTEYEARRRTSMKFVVEVLLSLPDY